MTPSDAVAAVNNALAESLEGIRVLGQYDAEPPGGDESAWVRAAVEHVASEADEFDELAIQQRVRIVIDCHSAPHNPERSMNIAESVRKALAGASLDGLDVDTGTFVSQTQLDGWASLSVVFDGRYSQEEF